MATNLERDSNDTHNIILDAAEARLLHFGYNKTTMAEIAEDAGMSAANLYRYFKNKQEIAAECATRCMDERLERLRRIVSDETLDPTQKLERYALELVDDSHALAGPDSRVGELVDNITRERSDLIHSRNAIHHQLLTQILIEGGDRGVFKVENPADTARYIFSTLFLFDVPLFVGLFDRAEFDDRARGVAQLIINGLRACPDAAENTDQRTP